MKNPYSHISEYLTIHIYIQLRKKYYIPVHLFTGLKNHGMKKYSYYNLILFNLLLLLLSMKTSTAQENIGYQTPPKVIADLD